MTMFDFRDRGKNSDYCKQIKEIFFNELVN